ncbi:MAG TPA: glycosyl transferase, partial [Alphaproteobacteria bacterium]|nr:glycosyl transferase [Alphaproteobacteria bacterium]
MEKELKLFSGYRPMELVLPSLYSEIEGPALPKIVEELSRVNYLSHITIGLDRATRAEFDKAKNFFSKLNIPHTVIWNDGPKVKQLLSELEDSGLNLGEPGKGR